MDPYAYPPPAPLPRTNTYAILSLVCGIFSWIVIPVIGAVLAIVFGHLARAEIRRDPVTEQGDGMAIAGLALGYAHLVVACLACMVFAGILGFAGTQAHQY